MPKVVIYVRVSTEEQVKHGYSLAQQKKECIDFAVKEGYEVDKIFVEEGESAKNLVRTELKKMFEYCATNKKNIDALVFWRWDRLSRGEQSDYVALANFFNTCKIKPLSVTETNEETPEGELLRWITQGTSRYEWRKIAERTKLGLRGAVEQGRWVNLAPVGYINDRNPDRSQNKSLLPCPVNAKFIKMAFELFATGIYSQNEVQRQLKIAGMKKCNKNLVSRILRNKVYIGYLTYHWLDEPKRGIFEPLVDEETFYKVQAILEGKKPLIAGYKRNREEFPLRQWVRCPNCNSPLTASFSKGRNSRYAYYHCHKTDCNIKFRIPKERLEDAFLEHLTGIRPEKSLVKLFREVVKDVYAKNTKEQRELLKQLETELTALTESKKKLNKKYLEDKISEADYNLMNADFDNETTTKKADIASLEIPSESIDKYLDYCCFVLNNVKDLWKNAGLDFRQRLQKLIYPDGVQYDLSDFRTHKKSVIFTVCEQLTDDLFNMGRVMGFEPTYIGTTIRGLNHLATPAVLIKFLSFAPVEFTS